MNERIQKLALQAGIELPNNVVDGINGPGVVSEKDKLAKFAELIVRECKENFAKVWYEQGVDCRGAELGKFMTRFEEHFGVEE